LLSDFKNIEMAEGFLNAERQLQIAEWPEAQIHSQPNVAQDAMFSTRGAGVEGRVGRVVRRVVNGGGTGGQRVSNASVCFPKLLLLILFDVFRGNPVEEKTTKNAKSCFAEVARKTGTRIKISKSDQASTQRACVTFICGEVHRVLDAASFLTGDGEVEDFEVKVKSCGSSL
jgi:hypothetical protein